jgi:hypothetical protein
MSHVAHPTTPSLAVRLRSSRPVWLVAALVAIASVVAVVAFVPGDDSASSSATPAFQPGVSAPHPNEGLAPIRQTGGSAYSARPDEGGEPIRRGSDGTSYTQRPQEGHAPIGPSR